MLYRYKMTPSIIRANQLVIENVPSPGGCILEITHCLSDVALYRAILADTSPNFLAKFKSEKNIVFLLNLDTTLLGYSTL